MPSDAEPEGATESTDPEHRYRALPEHVPLEDTIATVEADAAPDPWMGQDTERDFMLRNAGG